ncbi:hypothetical protein [Dehalogenimonas alkenigignens]|uniref:Uncharacterized protein n=1 Tax=Dehalogenimonas alkenigignens TaxID=1217799 RepID=A0A0W0GJP8_9CHLR|nr:hypothetical protein [Dehalogenimonas alkenigignens]KTB48794.1 hypothetical protein DEALK_16410 [Dehalogenimonas alkenigignens]
MDLILVMGLLLGAIIAGGWGLETEFNREVRPAAVSSVQVKTGTTEE